MAHYVPMFETYLFETNYLCYRLIVKSLNQNKTTPPWSILHVTKTQTRSPSKTLWQGFLQHFSVEAAAEATHACRLNYVVVVLIL